MQAIRDDPRGVFGDFVLGVKKDVRVRGCRVNSHWRPQYCFCSLARFLPSYHVIPFANMSVSYCRLQWLWWWRFEVLILFSRTGTRYILALFFSPLPFLPRFHPIFFPFCFIFVMIFVCSFICSSPLLIFILLLSRASFCKCFRFFYPAYVNTATMAEFLGDQ